MKTIDLDPKGLETVVFPNTTSLSSSLPDEFSAGVELISMPRAYSKPARNGLPSRYGYSLDLCSQRGASIMTLLDRIDW